MNLLRNKEVLINMMILGAVSLIATITAFLLDFRYGVLTIILCVVLMILFFVSTYQRYQRLRELSHNIDRILHGENYISFDRYQEGELAVLESEIQKMTVRLREQKQRLIEDKVYLANSIADISHQIRTPLTSINLLVSFLSEPDITLEKRQTTVRELYNLLSRMDWLITTLLKISKLDAGTIRFKKEEVSLKALIQKSVEPLLIPMELRGQELIIEVSGNFSGDIDWTSEAIGNVVKNCMEHTPESGKVEIRATENAIYQEIIISDTGSGIDKEDLPHVFERFYKGKNSKGNSFGVGLALARMIVSKQDGTIKVENKTDGGAMFTLRFYKKLSKSD